jgi:RNase P/RNase MRP subunit p30
MNMINTNNIEQAKKEIREAEKSKIKPIMVKAQDVDFNRKILEYGKFDILLSPETVQSKKSLRNIDSGLDYVMARSAAKHNISIGIDISHLPNLEKKEKAILFSKIANNIRICRKAGTKIKAINYNDKKDAFALLLSLGASTKQASDAFD